MTLNLPRSDYGIVLADPAWQTMLWSGEGRTPTQKQFDDGGDHYATMSLDEMKKLPVGDIAGKDCALAMWAIGSHLDQAIELGTSWGFTFKTDLFYWLKLKLIDAMQIDIFTDDIAPPKMGMGKYTRKELEPCLLFTRGKPRVLDHGVRQLIIEPAREHSRKPEAQYDRLERLFGKLPRAELFSRSTREGWDAWGNETGKFDAEIAA